MAMKTVGARFKNDTGTYAKTYYYLTDDMSIEVDDYCIVIGGDGAPSIVRINDANAIDTDNKATKVIIQKIDMKAFYEKQRLIVEREIKIKRLGEISKEFERKNKFTGLANHSEEAKQLLIELGYVVGNVEDEKASTNE